MSPDTRGWSPLYVYMQRQSGRSKWKMHTIKLYYITATPPESFRVGPQRHNLCHSGNFVVVCHDKGADSIAFTYLAFHLLPDSVVVKVPVEPAVGDAVMWCASESMFISSTPRLTVSRMFNLHRPSLRSMVLLLSLPLLNRILFLMQVLLRDGPGELVGTMDHNWLCILHSTSVSWLLDG
jgi:hypothetical protein